MFQKIVFTPPTALGANPSASASASGAFTLHDVVSSRQVSHAEGLIGPPAPRDVTRVTPGRDGTRDDTRYLSERLIVLEGEIWSSTQRGALDDWTSLSAAFQQTLISPGQLTITLPAGSGSTQQRWTNVVLAGPIMPAFEGGSNLIQYQVTLRANDPRWLGITASTDTLAVTSGSSSTNTVSNSGSAPAYPVFTFSNTAEVNQVQVSVPSAYTSLSPQGSPIVLQASGSSFSVTSSSSIDTLARTATSLGTNKLNARTEWPILYPGSSTWNWTKTSGSGSTTVTMTWYDAWW